jgi:hypothetical protein
VLQRQIAASLPGAEGGIGALGALSEQGRSLVERVLADAFGTTFWVAFGLVAASLIPALLLPRIRAQAWG